MTIGEITKYTLLLEPIDSTGTAASAFIKASNYSKLDFLLAVGAVTDDAVTLLVECCTANSTSGVTNIAVPFVYRRYTLLGTDDSGWGVATTSDSSGISLAADSADNNLYIVHYDPAENPTYQYVRLAFTQGSSTSDSAFCVIAAGIPRYASVNPPTDS